MQRRSIIGGLYEKTRGLKTIIVSALVSIAGTLAAVPDQFQQLGIDYKSLLPQVINVKLAGLVLLGLGIVFGLLRIITSTPVFQQAQFPSPPVVEPDAINTNIPTHPNL